MRPILGFLEHLGLNPESDDYKNHVKSLEDYLKKLSNPAEFNSLKLWIEKTLNSENIWESRAGFNLQQHYLDS
jgi:hypothetical protein